MIVRVLDKKAPDALAVPLFQGEQLASQLAELAEKAGLDATTLQNDFHAEAKEVIVLYPSNSPGRRFYLIGLGKKQGFADVQNALRLFCHRFKSKLPARLGVDLRHIDPVHLPRVCEAAVGGLLLGLYRFDAFPREKNTSDTPLFGTDKSGIDIMTLPEHTAAATSAVSRAEVMAGITKKIFDLVNAPGNQKTPEIFADAAVAMGSEYGFSVRVVRRDTLVAEGLDALLAVGKGSEEPPLLLFLEYGHKTRKKKTPSFGLVGKGITFDTGGISIKPSTNQHFMKSDMGGAAAVLGAFAAAAKLKLPVHLTGAIPVAENMPDGKALKPGDVIRTYAGKTVEVTDTDAEGRLVLADGLAYLLKHETPDVLLDVATLTGSVIRTLGYHAAGLFTNNEQLAAGLTTAGATCGEKLWRLPLWDEYGADLKSDVADLRNFTGKPMAEASSAAKFIEHFTAAHPAWAHIDIAGVAFGDSEFAQSKSATGFGIRLLTEFMENWQESGA
ncbi:MAG: leucyl aminopeptidase family protein [Saprospiraceae bacterium]|nr:leucyl aminopeptidase family protein [Saprospiraceae bacterium]